MHNPIRCLTFPVVAGGVWFNMLIIDIKVGERHVAFVDPRGALWYATEDEAVANRRDSRTAAGEDDSPLSNLVRCGVALRSWFFGFGIAVFPLVKLVCYTDGGLHGADGVNRANGTTGGTRET